MLSTILVPLDGSPLAERALAYASVLARRSGARLVAIEAVDTRSEVDAGAEHERTVRAEAYLQAVAARLTAEGLSVHGYVYHDDPMHAILDAASFHRADLIVMSTHGRGGLGRMLYGSVADQILRHATTPVLLVPSIVQHAWPNEGPLSIMVPLDGSALAEEALASAHVLSDVCDAKLTLLRVVQPPAPPLYGDGYAYVPFDQEAEIADARAYLDEQAAKSDATEKIVKKEVAVGNPSHVVGEMARALDVDVVVMATHGHGGLTRLILGSVASATLRHTTAPLLLVRPEVQALPSAAADAPIAEVTAVSPIAEVPGGRQPSPPAPASSSAAAPRYTVQVSLNDIELELVTRGLKALAYAPGYDYAHIQAARALAERLQAETPALVRQ